MKPHVKKFLSHMSVALILTAGGFAVLLYGIYGLLFDASLLQQHTSMSIRQGAIALSVMAAILAYLTYCTWDIYRLYRDHPSL